MAIRNISFRTQLCVCFVFLITVELMERWINIPDINLYGVLLCGISFIVHPAIPEKFPEKYQGKTGKIIVEISSIIITAIVVLLMM